MNTRPRQSHAAHDRPRRHVTARALMLTTAVITAILVGHPGTPMTVRIGAALILIISGAAVALWVGPLIARTHTDRPPLAGPEDQPATLQSPITPHIAPTAKDE